MIRLDTHAHWISRKEFYYMAKHEYYDSPNK